MSLHWTRWVKSPLIAFIAIFLWPAVTSDFLEPQPLDFIDFKGWKITASSTCGVAVGSYGNEYPKEEMYCQIDGAHYDSFYYTDKGSALPTEIKGQFCSSCDPRDPERNHSAAFALDTSDNWWQSPPLSRGKEYKEVNLTIDLGQELQVYYLIIELANSPRPAVWVLERSRDYGSTYTPWQYFATSPQHCADVFGIHFTEKITHDDSVICDTEQTKLVEPQKKYVNFNKDEIIISLVNNRPSAANIYKSPSLQEWTKATNIRFRFLQPNTHKADLMSLASEDASVTRRYFYSVRHITMSSLCICNGHAKVCNSTASGDDFTLICDCQHNTCGVHCDRCCKGFVQKKWRPSTAEDSFICEPCNCFGHSDECEYNPDIEKHKLSLDIHGNYNGGGKCINCKHNTEGINCHRCIPGFYRPNGKLLNATDGCKACKCDVQLHEPHFCYDGSGQCLCKQQYTTPKCDSCTKGYYGYPVCHECKCDPKRTQGSDCDVNTGKCKCNPNFSGNMCETCAEGYYNFPYCYPCKCNEKGSKSVACHKVTGQCSCKTHYEGAKCSKCKTGHFDFPVCTRCTCDLAGTNPDICNRKTGICICREGYKGKMCDQCKEGRYKYPDCVFCNCSHQGSSSSACDTFGNCSCHPNYSGRKCDQCKLGYYNYPKCFDCKCNVMGSIGATCEGNGKCQCKPYFDGMQCNRCKHGYYGFPNCTACNCDTKGVKKGSIGCQRLTTGELCPCKKNVKGRLCDECKEHHWNLEESNPEGCKDCGCFIPGVVGHTGKCDPYTGKCPCKYLVESHECHQCRAGTYNLRLDNLLGCSDCECSVGGSVNKNCDDPTGQCQCKPHVEGQRCSNPVDGYYFPTLHQYQFEAENGRTSSNDTIQNSFNQTEFPGYSWKGYVDFSHSQNEIVLNIEIEKRNEYQMVFHCLNLDEYAILVTITLTPERTIIGSKKKTFKVMLQPSKKPSFITVIGSSRNSASPILLDTGKWSLRVKTDSHFLLDYIVIIPLDYYKATALTQSVNNPCTMEEHKKGELNFCRHFCYPKVSHFNMAVKKSVSSARNKLHLRDCFDDEKVFKDIEKHNFPLVKSLHHELKLKLELSKYGEYILVIVYYTPGNNSKEFDMEIESSPSNGKNDGKITLYSCNYSSLCRQVIQDASGKIKIFHFYKKDINLSLSWKGDFLGIISIVAIPHKKWSLSYIEPKPACVKMNGNCMPTSLESYPHSKKIHFASVLKHKKTKISPYGMTDNRENLIHLDIKEEMISLKGNTSTPGRYAFVIHYYQPDYPGFDMKIFVDNGQNYEAKVHAAHCPSHVGCYSAVEKIDGTKYFMLNDKFLFTLKKLNHTTIWLEHLIIVSEERYEESVQPHDEEADQSKIFITHCAEEGLYIPSNTSESCRDSLFSITTKYNDGPLPCQCNLEGSESPQCAKFGGQCSCKANVIGRKCEQCSTGYFGFPDCTPCDCPIGLLCQPNNGSCICPPRTTGKKCEKCTEFSYGHEPSIGCKKCDCNELGVKGNQLQCDILSGDCKCQENIEGRTCDHCSPGFSSFPNCTQCSCNLAGTTPEICDKDSGECICRKYVAGDACDVCKEGTFNLDKKYSDGCMPCFCFKRTKNCTSSSLFRSKVFNMNDWHLVEASIQKQWLSEDKVLLKPYKKGLKIIGIGSGVQANFTSKEAFSRPVYFAAPSVYLGNKLSSYGGVLNYTINTHPASSVAADIILYGTDVYLFHHASSQPSSNLNEIFSVEFTEMNFKVMNQTPSTRDLFMLTLQNLKGLLIRAPNSDNPTHISLNDVVLETADVSFSSKMKKALSVEHCSCPENYKGLSCEECAPGYYHSKVGKYIGECILCQCNGHADTCDPQTGVCLDCMHYTTGEHCEKCIRGYYGHPTRGTTYDCQKCACPQTISSNNFAEECEMLDDGVSITCDCSPEYNGTRCEVCATGYYGRPDEIGEVCKPCDCFGNINPKEYGSCDPVTGKCMLCLNNTYGDDCGQCAPWYYGDAIHLNYCHACSCDTCGTDLCHGRTGACDCKEHVIGEKCDQCAPNHWNFSSCQGCTPCNCQSASESPGCDALSGQCKCRTGVTGLTCDQCAPGYWNYTADGCTPCGCNEEYSYGKICDAKTGQCECSQNLIGEKCDYCQERWMLVPKYGCIECDQCIHILLDISDPSEISLALMDLKNLAEEYHANQKITFINETASELYPLVASLIPPYFDAQSLVDDAISLEEGSTKLDKMTEILSGKMAKLKKDGLEMNREVVAAEEEINKTISQVNETVMKTRSLTFNIIEADAQYITDAQSLLKRIKDYDFSQYKNSAIKELEKSKKNVDMVQILASPVNKLNHVLRSTEKKVLHLSDKLEYLNNESKISKDKAEHASDLNKKMGIPQLRNKINILMNLIKDANVALIEARVYINNTTKIWSDIENVNENMRMLKEKLAQLVNLVETRTTSNEEGLTGLNDLVNKAKDHVNTLIGKAEELSGPFSNIHNTSEQAFKAANAYKNIIGAIKSAEKAADHARSAGDEALSMTEGLPQKAVVSGERSSKLYLDAKDAINNTQTVLMPNLKKYQVQLDKLYSLNKENDESMKNVNGTLQTIISKATDSLIENASNSANEVGKLSKDILPKIISIGDRTPAQLEVARSLSETLKEAKSNISLATREDKKRSKNSQKLKSLLERIGKKQASVGKKQAILKDQINRLREQINLAQDQIKRINVGVRLMKNSMLVLRNPPALSLLKASGKISMYFRTNDRNGLLLYLGNEVGTNTRSRIFKTDDFLALQIEDGFPTLTINLGSMTSDVKIDKFVADNKWYQVIVKRSGRSVDLTILEELKNEKVVQYTKTLVVEGSSSIFNLDQNRSRLIIGGYPQEYEIQTIIRNSFFIGEMDELYVGDNPVSFWNFILAKNVNGTEERDKLILKSETGLRFGGNGYAILNWTTDDMKTQSAIQLRFKTHVKDGLLFLVEKDGSFLSIELIDGKINLQFNLGDAVTSLISKKLYDDDMWHSVQATREKKKAKLTVDEDDKVYDKSEGEAEYLIVSDYIYFGGYPGEHNLPSVTQRKFDGCIGDVEINHPVDLSRNIKAFGITPGCPTEVDNIVSFVKGYKGYIRWAEITVDEHFLLNFRFNTTQENALLFYATDSSQMNSISLCLVDGTLILKGPQGKVQVSSSRGSSDPIKYNDGIWHSVTATYESNFLNLEIDDYKHFKSANHGPSLKISHGGIYFGGVPNGFNIITSRIQNQIPFTGCIGDATFASTFINFANASEIYNVTLGRCVMTGNIFYKPPVQHLQPLTAYAFPDEACSLPLHSVSDPNLVATNGYRFGTKPHSHMVFQKLPNLHRHKYKFEVELNTNEDEGIIFYLAEPSHRKFIALFLHQGKLFSQFDCGYGLESINTTVTVNDGIWHRVTLMRHMQKAKILVDKIQEDHISSRSHCNTEWMKDVTPYFVGGIPQSIKMDVKENLGLHKSFSGCLRNFYDTAGEILKPDVVHDLIPCSEQVEKGVFFSADGGYVIIDQKFEVGYHMIIEMEIKPRLSSGILIYVHGRRDYLVLQMYKGAVLFNVENGKGIISTEYMPSNQSLLCNGEWHKIKAIKIKNMISLSVDSIQLSPVFGPAVATATNTSEPLYLGGHAHFGVKKIGLKPRRQFVGCIRNVSIDSKLINMDEITSVGNVTIGVCPTI